MPVFIIAAIGALLAGLGYFGGQDMRSFAATGAAAPAHKGIAAVIISGDIGLNIGMGGQIADRFTTDGIPVIGINSLSFFHRRRSVGDLTLLIETAIRRALAIDHVSRVVLVGQSFGADVLPVGLAAMAPELRPHIAFVGLVVPAASFVLRASPAEIFSWHEPQQAVLPFARQLTWVPATCISGKEEAHSLCPQLSQANIGQVVLPGGHPLRRDSAAVYHALIAGIDASPAAT